MAHRRSAARYRVAQSRTAFAAAPAAPSLNSANPDTVLLACRPDKCSRSGTAFLLARTTTQRAETTIAATITLRDGWYRLSGFSAPRNEPCVFASYHMVAHPFTRRL